MESLLEVRDLTVDLSANRGAAVRAVNGASFAIQRGEVVGLIGESGCGKSTTALALLRLLSEADSAIHGSVRFQAQELLALDETKLEKFRGAEIALIFQEPSLALHPMKRVGDQVADVLRVHRGWNRGRCRDEARAALAEVALGDSERIFRAYPHQLSGGQRQRVVIALALACKPALVIADEPTASLDATTQAEILELFRELKQRHCTALILITHNPAILAGLADRVLVMYAGKIIEEGSFDQVIQDPLHPYTRALIGSLPARAGETVAPKQPLPTIAGGPPDPAFPLPGCAFEPRCPVRMDVCCARDPLPVSPQSLREVRCFHYGG